MVQAADKIKMVQAPRQEAGLLAVERINTASGLTALRGEWNALAESNSALPVFLTWEWASIWWEHFGKAADLWILAVRDHAGELAALAPLILTRSLGVNRLGFLGGGIAYPAHLDIIVRPGMQDTAAEAFLFYLEEHGAAWDCLDLRGLSAGSALIPALQQAPGRLQLYAPTVCPYMLLDSDWETFQSKTLDRKLRSNLKRCKLRLEQEHPNEVCYQVASEAGEVERILNHLKDFHLKRWSEKGYSTALDNPCFFAFLHDFALAAFEKGWLRAWELRVGEETGAVNIVFKKDRIVYGYQKGFDPQWKKYSPGQILQAEMIREVIHEGAEKLDMLVGEAHKDIWPAEICHDLNLFYCRGTKGKLWLEGNAQLERLRLFARKVLPKPIKRRLERLVSTVVK
jgi:CelD/BcsL family acetyltransferase involved in cellulose biosynthesis